MRSRNIGRPKAVISLVVALAALALPATASAVAKIPKPTVNTGVATHVLGTSALLTAQINPRSQETSYYFRYGPTIAYGSQTPTLPVGNGAVQVRVGQPIGPLQAGTTYHFRVVAVSTTTGAVLNEGRDRAFVTKGVTLAFSVSRTMQATYGSPFILSGGLTGLGAANHKVTLQASPYPFLEPFTPIGLPGTTNGAGSFSFRVANLAAATQFRLATLDALPIYSPVITVTVRVRVVLHVRSSGQPGLVRLYGTITPAAVGARVAFQVQKAVRPGASEVTTRYVTQFSTIAKKGPSNSSRFSMVTTIRHGGRYRAYVKMPKGPLASGPSLASIVLRAAKGKKG
jgi:hypothetical protein